MRWRLRMSTCCTRAANSRKVAYVALCLRRIRSIVHVPIESCLMGKTKSGGRMEEGLLEEP